MAIDLDTGGAGGYALAGYEYQIDVSVWLALDLVLGSKLTEDLVLEPSSQEDLEAELSDDVAGPVTGRARVPDSILVVQAKRRSGDAWAPSTLRTLLTEGGPKRAAPCERLKDPKVRYVLVTTAGLSRAALPLLVRRATLRPKTKDLPDALAETLPKDAGGRVAVIANHDEERVRRDIKDLLTENFRVPNARWEACFTTLREEARIRILGADGGHWRRPQLERVIRDHQGYIASSPELDLFVHPTNWTALRETLEQKHAVLIIGQSGTGKTLASQKLYDELRQAIPGLERRRVTRPEHIRDDQRPGPAFYDIEDPWGRFDFDAENSRVWNDQLAQIFRNAPAERVVIATSRLDVAQASGALETVTPWLFRLEAENYGPRQRGQLYRNRISELPPELRGLAAEAQVEVLRALATPLEIQKFFDAMTNADRQGLQNPQRYITEAIGQAHEEAIERTVIDQVLQRGDLAAAAAAAVLWALLQITDRVSFAELQHIEDDLVDLQPSVRAGLNSLTGFFVAARNLRQKDEHIGYYHPRVEKGLQQVVLDRRGDTRLVLRALIGVLTAKSNSGDLWGPGAAAQLLYKLKRFNLNVAPDTDAARQIDAWVAEDLAVGGRSLGERLKIAAAAGSPNSAPAEIARYLSRRGEGFAGLALWEPPDHGQAWFDRMRAESSTRPLLDRYIRDVLPYQSDRFGPEFITGVDRLADDLTPAFLAAAAATVGFGYIDADDVIAEGALADLEGFEPVLDQAVSVLTPTEEDVIQTAETHLNVINGVYDDDYAEFGFDHDIGHTAGVYLNAYARRLRKVAGWARLVQHRHQPMLLRPWLSEVAREVKIDAKDPIEVRAAFDAAYGGTEEELAWFVVGKVWETSYGEQLRARLLDGSPHDEVRKAALRVAVYQAPHLLDEVIGNWVRGASTGRLAEIALDLAQTSQNWEDFDTPVRDEAIWGTLIALPTPFDEIGRMGAVKEAARTDLLSVEACQALAKAQNVSEAVRRFRVIASQTSALDVAEDIRWLLNKSDDSPTAVIAVRAAIRFGLTREIEDALHHRFARVVAVALEAIGDGLPAPLPYRLLALSAHLGSPVRKALVTLLKAKPHEAHGKALMRLVGDHWSNAHYQAGEEPNYPIAQAAVEALKLSPPADDRDLERLFALALDTPDPDLRRALFLFLGSAEPLCFEDRLFDVAVGVGRRDTRTAAAAALLVASAALSDNLVGRITPAILTSRHEPVAIQLAWVLGARAEPEAVVRIGGHLATHARRRVLVLLLIRGLAARGAAAAKSLAALLPPGHTAVAWALGEANAEIGADELTDLGDPIICNLTHRFLAT